MGKATQLIQKKLGMSAAEFCEHVEKLTQEEALKFKRNLFLQSRQTAVATEILRIKGDNNYTWEELANRMYVSAIMLRKFCNRERDFSAEKIDFIERRLQSFTR